MSPFVLLLLAVDDIIISLSAICTPQTICLLKNGSFFEIVIGFDASY